MGATEGMPALQRLPFIKRITQEHLARNIGLADTEKRDLHLTRAGAPLQFQC